MRRADNSVHESTAPLIVRRAFAPSPAAISISARKPAAPRCSIPVRASWDRSGKARSESCSARGHRQARSVRASIIWVTAASDRRVSCAPADWPAPARTTVALRVAGGCSLRRCLRVHGGADNRMLRFEDLFQDGNRLFFQTHRSASRPLGVEIPSCDDDRHVALARPLAENAEARS